MKDDIKKYYDFEELDRESTEETEEQATLENVNEETKKDEVKKFTDFTNE